MPYTSRMSVDERTRELLALTLTPGLGPVLVRRAIEVLGSPGAVLGAGSRLLLRVEGIGERLAQRIARGLAEAARRADEELGRAERLSVEVVPIWDGRYPGLLSGVPDAPMILYVRGVLDGAGADRYAVAIVGSRRCTPYGVEQTRRFAGRLAGAGITVVSGGARGIDTSAHRAALESGGRTIAVLGCGLARCYPPDNAELFDRIADGGGAVVSELPLESSPQAENFPSRNRIISGLSLGVLVVEAGRRSGALITARVAAEDHGREVFVLPGRVDSSASEGSLKLLMDGGAAPVVSPEDIIGALESPAMHHFRGTHAVRYGGSAQGGAAEGGAAECEASESAGLNGLSVAQRAILDALGEPRTLDELSRAVGLGASELRAELTMLEVSRRVRRSGTRVSRA